MTDVGEGESTNFAQGVLVNYHAAQLHKLAYMLKNSTTKLLPKWFSVLEDLQLDKCMMPHDVTTHWNSTFDMLDFCNLISNSVACNYL